MLDTYLSNIFLPKRKIFGSYFIDSFSISEIWFYCFISIILVAISVFKFQFQVEMPFVIDSYFINFK